jgi:hypothetical protein
VRSTSELIDRILKDSRIPPGKRRREIQRELCSHIEDFVAAALENGRGRDEIETLVMAHFGDPVQIAGAFAWVYRHERRRLRILIYTLSTILLASTLFAAILAAKAGLALGFGEPVVSVFASRHTAIEAFDIVASVAVYVGLLSLEGLFDRRSFPKAVLLLGAAVAVLLVIFKAAHLHSAFLIFGFVNGIFFRAIRRLVTPGIVRAAIVAACFLLAGFISASIWSPGSNLYRAASCASWLASGAGYLLMTHFATGMEAALLNRLFKGDAA